MGRATAETIRDRLKNGFDVEEHNRLYRLSCIAFGRKEDAALAHNAEGDFPDFPDVVPTSVDVGQSKRILNAQYLRLTQAQSGEVEPELTDYDKYTAEVVKQVYLRRGRGQNMAGHRRGEWGPHRALAFLSGDGVGVGWLQVGLKTNKATGMQYTYARHVQSTHVIWDPYVSDPGDATWLCFVHNMDPDRARALYGKKVVDQNLRTITDSSYTTTSRQLFRVFEYYDRGVGDDDPTMCLIPGNMGNEPIAVVDNPFDECLPAAHYSHFIPPNAKRPIGRILLQVSTQEAINRVEARWKETCEQGRAFDIIDLSAVSPEDVKDIKAGKVPRFIRFTKFFDGKPPFVRVPAVDVSPSDIQLLSLYERQMADDSGTTDHDRGVLSSSPRTLGENVMLDEKQAPKVNWSRGQAAHMERRLVETWMYIAKRFDLDPIQVDVFGTKVLINDPNDPRSALASFLQDPTEVLIDEANLEYQDAQRKQGMRLANLEQLLPLVGKPGGIDPEWMTRESLKAIGEKDVDAALMKMPMGMPGAPGMPMAPPGQMMPPGVPPSPGMNAPEALSVQR